jgi:hypothetical protein
MSIASLLFLSSDELRELTDLKIAKAQMRWLEKHAYPFEISAAGKPKVLRSFVLDRLKSFTTSSQSTEPNFDAIR